MSGKSTRHSSIAELSKRSFAGLLGVVVALGLLVQTYLVFRTTSWTTELERIVGMAPVAVAVLAYVRNRPTAPTWEIGGVALWGFAAQWLAVVAFFVVGPAVAGSVSVSAIVLSGADELRLAELLRFLGTTAVLGGLYAVAASHRDRPIVSAVALLAVPVATVIVYALV